MNGNASVNHFRPRMSTRVLAVSDVLAILLFAIVGRIFHSAGGPVDWLTNAPRIVAPFLVGWVAAAMVLGAYPRAGQIRPSRFVINSILTLLVGDLIAFGIRVFFFDDVITWPFVMTALAFTTLFVVGPRLLYCWAMTARTLRRAQA
jgi:biotin transporter BioY